ncbi:ABC transporter permease [Lacticaseibacillus sp. GG6-2]
MGTLVKQELFKLTHKKGTWFAVIFMVLVQVGFAGLRLKYPDFMALPRLIANGYIGGMLVLFIMIASCASTIAMEFQYGTIKQLLYRQYYRSQVFVSKLIVLVLQLVVLQAIACAVSFLLTVILFPEFDWQQSVAGGNTWIQQYGLALAGNLLMMLLLLSVVVLLATLFKTNAAAIATGFIGYFVIQAAASLILLLIQKWEWLKWNPFTMLLIGSQMAAPKVYSPLTHLDTGIMALCTFGYTVLFTLIAYLSFRRRSV